MQFVSEVMIVVKNTRSSFTTGRLPQQVGCVDKRSEYHRPRYEAYMYQDGNKKKDILYDIIFKQFVSLNLFC